MPARTPSRLMIAWLLAAGAIGVASANTYKDTLASSSGSLKRGTSVRCGGGYTSTHGSDDGRECLTEAIVLGRARLEHIWTFKNVPPGRQFFTFEGFRPAGSNDAFEFHLKTASGYVLIGGSRLADGCERITSVPLGISNTKATTITILLADTLRSDDTQLDTVNIDTLRIVTQPFIISAEAVCSDGTDNDCDGARDCLDDDCFTSPACRVEVCYDGLDNDGDGAIDCADNGCLGSPFCAIESNCSDLIDNDDDGATDCSDPDCAVLCSNSEICHDSVDNDADGATDCADSDCSGTLLCAAESSCFDGFDNDNDGYTDCNDPGCASNPNCVQP